MERRSLPPAASSAFSEGNRTPLQSTDRFLPITLVAAAVILALGGYFFYRHQAEEKRDTALATLATIADLKENEIAHWMLERRGDAEVARTSPAVRAFLREPDNARKQEAALHRIGDFRGASTYHCCVLANTQGKILLKSPGEAELDEKCVGDHVSIALQSSEVDVSNLIQRRPENPMHLWISCPVFEQSEPQENLLGALLLVVDPHEFLLPVLQRWPAPTRTAEALLVVREGEDVAYVSGLHRLPGGSANIRFPLTGNDRLPAAMAVQGFEGIVEGVDYNGVPVFAATRKIPDTPWFLITKMNREEVLAPIYREGWVIALITALLIAATLLAIGYIERRHRFESLRDSARRFQALVENAPVAVCITRSLTPVYANPKYLRLFGLNSFQEMAEKPILERWAPEFQEVIEERIRRRAQGLPVPNDYEGVGQRKDGTTFPIHLNVATVELPDGPANVAFLLDITERKLAGEALKASEARFRALIEKAPMAISISRKSHRIYANQKFLEMFGFANVEEAIGQPIGEQWAPESRVMIEERSRNRALGLPVPNLYEAVAQRKDGYCFPVQIAVAMIELPDGPASVGFVTDITERKGAEQHIRRLNRLYAVLSGINTLIVRERNPEAMLEGACRIAVETGNFRMAWIGIVNEATQILEPKATAGVLDGYMDTINIDLKCAVRSSGPTGRAIMTGEHQVCNDVATDSMLVPWRDAALARGYLSSTAFPLRVAGKVVGTFPLYASETNFFDSDELRLLDELAGHVSFALEMHQKELERQQAERNLRSNEERFRLLIENASDMVVVFNEKGIIRFASPSVRRGLGYEPDEMLNRNGFEIIHPEDRPKAAAAIQQALAESTATITVECRFQHRDGSWRILQSVGHSIPNQAPDGFIVINSRDITDSRNLEEQFRQSQKLEGIGQLAGGVAHDFNNMLGAMTMLCELTQTVEKLPKRAYEYLQEMLRLTESAANLTRQLLLFSRRQVMQPRDLDLNESVTALAKLLQRIIGEDIRLQLHVHPAPLSTHADPGMLEQVLLNLAINARDAMPKGGRLLIETSAKTVDDDLARRHPDAAPGRYACLSVSDTGSGICPEVLPHIFEPFFTTKEAGKGTGLGLATVFGIVKQHGGWMSVETAVGKGTNFHAYFPLIEARVETETRAPAQNAAPGGKETILLVEDENIMRMITSAVLEHAGYRVIKAAHGVEALKLWEQCAGDVQLLLTDMVMPEGIGGRDLANQLQERKPGLKVVLTSGYSADIAGRELLLRPGQVFIQKPCSGNELLKTVRTCLDN